MHALSPRIDHEVAPAWSFDLLKGRLSELTATPSSASLTFAAQLVLEAQKKSEPVAWICDRSCQFYPPDFVMNGVDISSLAIIHVPDAQSKARAAAELLRSGAFGLLVLDIGTDVRIPMPLQSRLLGLVQKYEAALLFLTRGDPLQTLGSLISLRAETRRKRRKNGGFLYELEITKDKKRGPGATHAEVCRGCTGLY